RSSTIGAPMLESALCRASLGAGRGTRVFPRKKPGPEYRSSTLFLDDLAHSSLGKGDLEILPRPRLARMDVVIEKRILRTVTMVATPIEGTPDRGIVGRVTPDLGRAGGVGASP